MDTSFYEVDPQKPDKKIITLAATAIKRGDTVVFPTETVYGLGADGTSEKAIKKIFQAKKRPQDNPLILHIANFEDLFKYCKIFRKGESGKTRMVLNKLMENFWPGPLTLILQRDEAVPPGVSAGLDTVAIRMPAHPVALSLIEEAGVTIAAPSANLSGKPSPTRAWHVKEDLWGRVGVILDAGPTGVGVESTVLDMSGETYRILRPGGVNPGEIEEVLGEKIEVYAPDKKNALSPGLKYKHYAPEASLILVEGDKEEKVKQKLKSLREYYSKKGLKVALLVTEETKEYFERENGFDFICSLGSKDHLEEVAKNLYSSLRDLDDKGAEVIIAESIQEKGLGLAIANRLKKAAADKIIRV